MRITQVPSPNYTTGRGGKKINKIVIHWIVGRLSAADAVFKKAGNASAHYGVGQNGEVHQYVKESNTAYHAGNFTVNQESIGIEHEGAPSIPVSDSVYDTSATLIADIWKRYGKLPLYPHKQFKATQCPGTLDLNRLQNLAEAKYNNKPSTGGSNNMPSLVKDNIGPARIGYSNILGRDWNQSHTGKFDAEILKNYGHMAYPDFYQILWTSDEAAKYQQRLANNANLASQVPQKDSQIKSLGDTIAVKAKEVEELNKKLASCTGSGIDEQTKQSIMETNALVKWIKDMVARIGERFNLK